MWKAKLIPVRRARGAAASAENALIHPIQNFTVLLVLKVLLHSSVFLNDLSVFRRFIALQPWLNSLILSIEIRHIRHQILYDVHVGKRINFGLRRVRVDSGEAGQGIATVNVHSTRSADSLPARTAESQSRILLILDLYKGVEDHGPTLIKVNGVCRNRGGTRSLWIPPVNLKILDSFPLQDPNISVRQNSYVQSDFTTPQQTLQASASDSKQRMIENQHNPEDKAQTLSQR